MDKGTGKSIYLWPEHREKIERIAARAGVSSSVIVRWLIEAADEAVFSASLPTNQNVFQSIDRQPVEQEA